MNMMTPGNRLPLQDKAISLYIDLPRDLNISSFGLATAWREKALTNQQDLVLDAANVSHINGAGLGMLLALHTALHDAGLGLTIENAQGDMLKMVTVFNMENPDSPLNIR